MAFLVAIARRNSSAVTRDCRRGGVVVVEDGDANEDAGCCCTPRSGR